MIKTGCQLAGRALSRLQQSATLVLEILRGPGRFRCPVCDQAVRRFLPLPDHFRNHLLAAGWPYRLEDAETCNAASYSCPHCFASDRDRLCVLYLDAHLMQPAPGPRKLVQFAPSAPLSRWIERTIQQRRLALTYRTADLHMKGVDDRLDIMEMGIYGDASLDFFLCSHVLEHVRDDRKALRELYRVLRPGGGGILLVPIIRGVDRIDEDPDVIDPHERWRRFAQDDHVRQYSRQGFLERVREAGFVVSPLDVHHFGADCFDRHGITVQSVLYVVRRLEKGCS